MTSFEVPPERSDDRAGMVAKPDPVVNATSEPFPVVAGIPLRYRL
jgi:hypothetical protein